MYKYISICVYILLKSFIMMNNYIIYNFCYNCYKFEEKKMVVFSINTGINTFLFTFYKYYMHNINTSRRM